MTPAARETATAEVLAAHAALEALVVAHGLPVRAVNAHPSHAGSRETERQVPILPTVQVTLEHGDTAGLLAWCEALGVEWVVVDRGGGGAALQTIVRLARWDLDGFDFTVAGSIPRRSDRPRLPGVRVDWPKTRGGRPGPHARISVEELATAARGLGLLAEEATTS